MRFAFLIGGELRGINKTTSNLYKYIIDYYKADILLLCQRHFEDDDERIKLFDRNVVYCKLYDKPDPLEYFNNANIYLPKDGWNKPGNLQIYINMNEYAKVLESYKDKYDYFIHLRPDIEIVFPFPCKSFFEAIPNNIYIFDPEYCKHWGGLGIANFIHSDYVIDYFSSYYDLIKENFNDSIFTENNIPYQTQEFLLVLALKRKRITMIPIKNINFFYTAETTDDRTSMNVIKYHSKYNDIICKYEEQVNECFQNLELWNKNYKWTYNNNEIYLTGFST